MAESSLSQRVASEGVGTALLVAAVIGSGVMGERLAGGNTAIALLANTIATGTVLVVLIITLGPLSGAHFNPVVSLASALQKRTSWQEASQYVLAQIAGGFAGAMIAHLMFRLPLLSLSEHARHGSAQFLAEFIATFGLVCVIEINGKKSVEIVALVVGAYIASAYWFASSTSFANRAVTLARSVSNTFAGIKPADVPAFLAAQVAGALVAVWSCRWLSSVRVVAQAADLSRQKVASTAEPNVSLVEY